MDDGATSLSTRWRRVIIVASMASLVTAIVARVLGPVDTWDQRQPRTVSYTIDILVNGGSSWVLPVDLEGLPATKPPLYNWLAVPGVALLGPDSDLAHKLPSVAALALLWLAVVRVGRRIDPEPDGAVGWLAGMMVPASYTFFKLGYLARPDMALTLWLFLGWVAATALLAAPRDGAAPPRRRWQVAFWLCVAAAALTKGPQALWLPAYVIVGARVLRGSFREALVAGWGWGAPLAIGLFGAWVAGVFVLDREHLLHELWFEEFFGRVTGTGHEGNLQGPIGFVTTFFHLPFYFLTRFAPWSLAAIAGIVALWRGGRWRSIASPSGAWMHGAALAVVTVVGLFTLSTGKRGDYVSAACAPGALVAAWWLLRGGPRWGIAAPWLAPVALAVTLATLVSYNQRELGSDEPGLGDGLLEFAQRARPPIMSEPGPLVFREALVHCLPSYLGHSGPDGLDRVPGLVERREPFWVVSFEPGGRGRAVTEQWLAGAAPGWRLEERCRSGALWYAKSTFELALYRVAPR